MSKWILNILLALGLFAGIVALLFIWSGFYTNHGKEIAVPNIKGMQAEKAIEVLEDNDLQYNIFDSVYEAKTAKNAITAQDPEPGSKVKPGRIIYLSINSLGKPKVKMPKLVDQSFTLGKAILKKVGLELGNVYFTYEEIGHNLILRQKQNNIDIPPGKLIEKGSKIDLIIATDRVQILNDTLKGALTPYDEALQKTDLFKKKKKEKNEEKIDQDKKKEEE